MGGVEEPPALGARVTWGCMVGKYRRTDVLYCGKDCFTTLILYEKKAIDLCVGLRQHTSEAI